MRVLVTDPIDANALETLCAQHDVVWAHGVTEDILKAQIENCDVVVFRSSVKLTATLMECAAKLKLLIRAGSGIDNIDMDYVRQRGLRVERVPEPGAKAVAEMAFALMLALSRNLLLADQLTKKGRWAKHQLAGYLLNGKVLGVVGVGLIGSLVGKMGVAWGMFVIGCVEHPSSPRVTEFARKGIRLTSFDEVIEASDYVSVHVPLQSSTHNLIDTEVLSRMKSGAFLINLARGGVVNEKALYKALIAPGRLRGAALDVHEVEGEGKISPLSKLPNAILTPHLGAMTIDSQHEIGQRVIEIINEFANANALVGGIGR